MGVRKIRDEGRNTIIYAACDVYTHAYVTIGGDVRRKESKKTID